MNAVFAQVDQAIETGGQVLTGRSDALIILVAILALGALWIWKVVIPERDAHKNEKVKQLEIQHTQAQTLAALSNVSAQTSEDAYVIRTNTDTLLATKEVELRCFQKIDQVVAEVDLSSELSEMDGMLKLAKLTKSPRNDP